MVDILFKFNICEFGFKVELGLIYDISVFFKVLFSVYYEIKVYYFKIMLEKRFIYIDMNMI